MQNEIKINPYVNRREKVIGFIYVLVLFLAITGICSYILMTRETGLQTRSRKEVTIRKMDRLRDFRQIQSAQVPVIDSLYNRITEFSPAVNASYEENDIKFLIQSLDNQYERNSWDKRYRVFKHVSSFYHMWFTDKKELWSKQENISRFRKNLEECEIGLEKKKEELKRTK